MISRCHVANAFEELKGSKQSDVGMTGMYIEPGLWMIKILEAKTTVWVASP
jgi:hypothetical protein